MGSRSDMFRTHKLLEGLIAVVVHAVEGILVTLVLVTLLGWFGLIHQ